MYILPIPTLTDSKIFHLTPAQPFSNANIRPFRQTILSTGLHTPHFLLHLSDDSFHLVDMTILYELDEVRRFSLHTRYDKIVPRDRGQAA